MAHLWQTHTHIQKAHIHRHTTHSIKHNEIPSLNFPRRYLLPPSARDRPFFVAKKSHLPPGLHPFTCIKPSPTHRRPRGRVLSVCKFGRWCGVCSLSLCRKCFPQSPHLQLSGMDSPGQICMSTECECVCVFVEFAIKFILAIKYTNWDTSFLFYFSMKFLFT